MKRIKQILVAFALMVTPLAMAVPVKASTDWNINSGSTIDFSCLGNDTHFLHTLNSVVQNPDGSFTGQGDFDANAAYTWNVNGNIVGDGVDMVITYTGLEAPYVYNLNYGVIAGDGSVSGFVSDINGNCQTFSMPIGTMSAATPTLEECSTVTSVHTTNLSTWDLTQTRSAGHNQLIDGGLHIWTDTGVTGTPDPRKAAGYYLTNFPLSGLGGQTIDEALDYQFISGTIEPGLQLVVDFDNDGILNGILVGESVYGNDWWLTGSSVLPAPGTAPQTGGGFGSNRHGTINEWLALYPNAQVKAIGYSLGSGVDGDGVIKRISLGCVDYTFDKVVASKDECKNDGWKLGLADGRQFKNQGDCVSYFATGMKNAPSAKMTNNPKF